MPFGSCEKRLTERHYYHVCAFFNSQDEEYQVLAPFFKEGLDQGEKNVHIVSPAMQEEHRARLDSAGINTLHCESCGQLEVLPWHQAYIDKSGAFIKEKMLRTIDELTSTGVEAGYDRVRIMGNMGWVFEDFPGAADILEYEAEVNEVLSRNRQPAVCVYDISKLSGSMMMDLLRTHPLTLIGGVIQENPFFTPPDEMIKELRARNLA